MVEVLPLKSIEEKISHLYPKKYNKYYWWRRYNDVQELDKNAPILAKINNGDYDFPSYYFQAQHEIYRMEEAIKDIKYSEDRVDTINLYMERYRRLMEDAYKEENRRMDQFKKRMIKVFKITKQDLENIMNTFDGTLEELYYHLQKNK